ncbi:60S ribosomal protein L34, partial [Salmonella sp. s51228]|uniref:60S ribosomal protein L34 n=1 Tax=Salmonella sp. s51228 TaxID=3159652 RepID=UPI00397FAF1E
MVQRLTYRRRTSYRTKSNKVRISKTPGGRLVYLKKKKKGKQPASKDAPHGGCKKRLNGIPALRPHKYRQLSKCRKNVS